VPLPESVNEAREAAGREERRWRQESQCNGKGGKRGGAERKKT